MHLSIITLCAQRYVVVYEILHLVDSASDGNLWCIQVILTACTNLICNKRVPSCSDRPLFHGQSRGGTSLCLPPEPARPRGGRQSIEMRAVSYRRGTYARRPTGCSDQNARSLATLEVMKARARKGPRRLDCGASAGDGASRLGVARDVGGSRRRRTVGSHCKMLIARDAPCLKFFSPRLSNNRDRASI
jgi:hypothetical protein